MSGRDPYEVQERAAEARALLSSPLMKEIFESLQAEYTERLIQAEVGSLTAGTLHASMKVLADVQGRLKAVETDSLFLNRKSRKI